MGLVCELDSDCDPPHKGSTTQGGEVGGGGTGGAGGEVCAGYDLCVVSNTTWKS